MMKTMFAKENSSIVVQNKKQLALERGKRIRMLRALSGLSRNQFQSQLGVSISTLNIWENGKICLTEKGANRIVTAVSGVGISCSSDWLLSGIGTYPSNCNDGVTSHMAGQPFMHLSKEYEQEFTSDIEIFMRHYQNSVLLSITDDAMAPFYNIGDVVIGVPIDMSEIQKMVGMPVIISFNNRTVLRNIAKIEDDVCIMGYLNQFMTNDNISRLPLKKVSCVAKVLLHRSF